MRKGAGLELVKAEENDWWIQMRDDCLTTTGKHEAWREDARVGCLEGGGTGFCAPERTSGGRISALEAAYE